MIPLQQDAAAKAKAGGEPTHPLVRLVEDNPIVLRSIKLLLSAKGFRVDAYSNGLALLEATGHENCVCLITDQVMDDINGLELLRRLRAQGWTGPALLITGHVSQRLPREAAEVGFVQVLEKPFRDGQLIAAIRAAIEGHCPR